MLACPGLSHSGNNVLKGSDHGANQDYKACKPDDPNLYRHDGGSFSPSPVATFARRQKTNLKPTRKFPFCHLPHLQTISPSYSTHAQNPPGFSWPCYLVPQQADELGELFHKFCIAFD